MHPNRKLVTAAAFLTLTLSAFAQQRKPQWSCAQVLPSGQTVQQAIDAALTASAASPDSMPELITLATSTRIQFDTLCQVDARLGTSEARTFMEQEVGRQQRILAAMQADIRAKGGRP